MNRECGTPGQRIARRIRSAAAVAIVGALSLVGPSDAAELTLADGVVVKFGGEAQLVVRDRLVSGKAVRFTSLRDDTVGGQTGQAPQSPSAGDWAGMRVEASTASFGASVLDGLLLRYGATALNLRASASTLSGLSIADSVTGLRLESGFPLTLTGANFQRNSVGVEVESATPSITASQFVGQTSYAIHNKTPYSVVQATGNWWGHVSGPKDAVGNPAGEGDAVSAGVNYGSYLAAAPLLNPTARLATPAPFFEQREIELEVSCTNAVEYRIAENNGFAGIGFSPMPDASGRVVHTVSAGDGTKALSVQFRSATGALATVSVDGVRIDTEPPTLAVTNPSAGAVIGESIFIEADAADANGIAGVTFYVGEALLGYVGAAPYRAAWNIDSLADGNYSIKVVATDNAGRSSEVTRAVTLSRAPVAPDTEGPTLTNIRLGGTPLADGATLTRDATITLDASDRSGVSRIELLLDGAVIATGSGAASYTIPLDIAAVTNGAHALVIRALDSLGNTTSVTYAITVAHVGPDAPRWSSPPSGTTTRSAEIAVSGTAKSGSAIRFTVNNQPSATSSVTGSDGRFSATLTLVAGANEIRAIATDDYGSSTPSAALLVTLDVTVPASPSALTAIAQPQGKVRLSWTRSTDPNAVGYHVYRASSSFAALAEAVKLNATATAVTVFEDLPVQDGVWFYRVVAVNAAGTPSEPTNIVQIASDGTAPRASSVSYTTQGQIDPDTGRYGQGRITVTVTVSEALQTTPYFAVVPEGGAPITVALIREEDTRYTGAFLIEANTPSGVANVLFSARDLVGNRGTEVDAGATLGIDTAGPVLSNITLTPASPIKNEGTTAIQAVFALSKAVKPGTTPTLSYRLSGPQRSPVALGGLAQVDAKTWRASFTLPSDAGSANPETLSFALEARDALDNVSTKVSAFNSFQVYQGSLPPLAIPFGFTAVAQPGGKVRLAWQAEPEAASYQLYRQAPGETALTPLTRSGGEAHIDQTPRDGTYQYAIASVREANGEETLSGQSAAVEVQASATAPGAPQNLELELTGRGILASWSAPLASTVATYNLYRAAGSTITSIEGLTPFKSGIRQPQVLDASPSPTEAAYVVTALDAVGNESAISNSAYLNPSLLPVRDLKVEQLGNALPKLTWAAPNGTVRGYLVYVGPESALTQLTPDPISALTFTDTGYTSGERRYTVASVDASGLEARRSVVLPAVTSTIAGGLPIKRGLMNRLELQVTNTSSATLSGVRGVVRLPTNKDATTFQDHRSAAFSLAANETRLIPVIVGGYAELPGSAQASVGVEIAPVEGELVKIAHEQTLQAIDGALVVGMATDAFTRGGTGKVKLTIENTSEVDIELLTATANGAQPSNELRFKLLDGDGNVLATQPYKQVFGASVVTLTNGLTVARIGAGERYTSDTFELNVPGAAPTALRVQLEIDRLRYHTGQEDQVLIGGRGAERVVSLIDTAYYGEVTDVAPLSSFGDEPVLIQGRALDRATGSTLPNTRLKLVLNQQGFERAFSVLTDGSGAFTYTFEPTLTDAGLYRVSAVHPEITDRPEQKAFTINRITASPSPYKLDIPKNYAFTVPFQAKAGAGTAASNVRFTYDTASQPTGQLPEGITLRLPAPVTLAERQTLNLPVVFTASNAAQPSGAVILNLVSDEHAASPIGQVRINYTLSEAKPYLTASPSFVETGMARGATQVESVTVENKGLQDALGLHFTLTRLDGTAAPAWVAIASSADGTLALGEKRSIDIAFSPPADLPEAVYEFRLNVAGENVPTQSLNVYASVTQSGVGSVFFKAADIYTATFDKQGNLIPGLANATITMQNEDVATVTQELLTDAFGEATFQNLPAGRYKFRARAANHQEVGGRIQVKPGITVNQPVFLDYNLITVEWSVREITIEDRYEITLNATFETDVPAAVVVLQPTAINLPKMNPGDVFYGELSLTNYGLIRADAVQQHLPKSDGFFRYEFLVDVPPTLEAKQRVTIPYRVVALQSLESAAGAATSSGGGCFNYSNTFGVTCKFKCANGSDSGCGSSTVFSSGSSSTCPAGSGEGSSSGSSHGPAGPTAGGWGGGYSPIKLKGKKCVFVPRGGGPVCQ